MFLVAGSSVMGQKEARQASLKMYLPVQFNAGNYQGGTYTWGRWYAPGIEVGMNLKKKRFEQEFILGSPRSESYRYYHERDRDSISTYYIIDDVIQTGVSFNYQAGYSIYTSKSGKINIVPGLGMALHASFVKRIRYDDALGVIDYKMQTLAFNPYLFTTFRYALNEKWSAEASFMYSPYFALYWRSKFFYNSGDKVDHYWGSGDSGKAIINSRFGVSYKF